MPKIIVVARRELRAYFTSPVAYIVMIFFLVVTAVWFYYVQQFFAQNTATLRGYFTAWPLVMIVLLPAISMRSWAEERRQGTAEILLTLPFREGELVLGKFLASLSLLGMVLLLSLPVPITATALGSFDWGTIAMEYLGLLLLGCAGLAAGQFISALSAHQISAFLFGVLFMLVLTMIGRVPAMLVVPTWLVSVLSWLSLDFHFDSFSKGVLDSRDALYFIVLAAGFLYFTTKVLLLRRFR